MLPKSQFTYRLVVCLALLVGLAVTVGVIGGDRVVQATLLLDPSSTIVEAGYVLDDFSKLHIKKPDHSTEDLYWWIINNGAGQQYYNNHGNASSIKASNAGADEFARLEIEHDAANEPWDGAEYIGTEISEYQTMYSAALPGRWLPTLDHPVIITAQVRFSANYLADGSGGAVGSAGMWMWNSYPDPQTYVPIQAFGFQWLQQGSVGGMDGLQLTAAQDSYPIYSQLISPTLDLTAWHTWSLEWAETATGEQTLAWRLDGELLGETTLTYPYAALSLTLWNDNQHPVLTETGDMIIVFSNPAAAQDFDINWVEIYQPQ